MGVSINFSLTACRLRLNTPYGVFKPAHHGSAPPPQKFETGAPDNNKPHTRHAPHLQRRLKTPENVGERTDFHSNLERESDLGHAARRAYQDSRRFGREKARFELLYYSVHGAERRRCPRRPALSH